MPTNSEMFDRGVQDAEHDELNHFYYQHYYYYRRGYDQARRQERSSRRSPLLVPLLTIATLMVLAFGGWQLRGLLPLPEPTARQPELPTLLPATVVVPTVIRPSPIATTAPTVTPTTIPTLVVNGQAVIENLNGAPLRARTKPGIRTSIVARIPEGSTVFLREGPVEADGYTWWRIEFDKGSGWVAERSPEGVAFLRPLP